MCLPIDVLKANECFLSKTEVVNLAKILILSLEFPSMRISFHQIIFRCNKTANDRHLMLIGSVANDNMTTRWS